jgi:hypothetical protein
VISISGRRNRIDRAVEKKVRKGERRKKGGGEEDWIGGED